MIKTVTLTANSELAVEIVGGCHCCVENRGEGIIYASKSAGVTADSDGVTAINAGSAKVLRNIAQYRVENNTYDYYGKIYLLSDSDCKAEIQTADDLNFFKCRNSGGGDSKSIKADIAELQENKADKSDVYSKTETDNKLSDYSYTYSGSSADKKNYYYCISESEVTGTSSFESIQLVLALRQVSVLNSNSAKFGIIQVQGRYDQNGDGTDDNTFTVVNVNWVLSSNIQTDNFFVVYNNTEKKIRLYYKSNSTYDGVVAQKIFDDINSPSAPANPTVLVKDTTGIAALPEDWIIASQVNSTTSNADFRVLADIVLNNPEIAVYNAGNKKILYGSKIEENGTVSAAVVSSFKNLATGKCEILKGYKSIGDCAFYGCTSLTEMNIPNSVTSIGAIAFEKCSSLKSVTIPNTITTLKNGTFFDCSSLTSVTIPDSVTVMEKNIFANCTSLTEITIPGSVTSIGFGVLRGTSITEITIPDSITSIPYIAFADCTSLTEITIPNSVTSVGERVFEDCTSLSDITIPDSVTSIGSGAFNGCASLTTITINKSRGSISGSPWGATNATIVWAG